MYLSSFLVLSSSLLSGFAQAQKSVVSINVAGAASPSQAVGASGVGALPASNTGAIGAAGGQVPVWVVKVGSMNNDLIFAPNIVNAKVGEFVQFQFYSRNHSVVSSTFEQPCVPNLGQPNAFYSGFMPTQDQGSLTYTIPIKDTNPLWFYCGQSSHCQGGMVGVINPPPGNAQTLQTYSDAAKKVTQSLTPNGGPSGGTPAGGQIGASGTAGGAIAQSTRSAASMLRRASWELVCAGVLVWFML